jgi:amino-acid N-acetyltransferase
VSATIRTAQRQELPEVLALLKDAGLPGEGVAEHFGSFLVARDSDGLVGAIGLECYRDVGLLRSLVVRPSKRGRGWGARLVNHLLSLARDNEVSTVYLLTTTADGFFPRFGFTPITRDDLDARLEVSAELQGACPETAVIMRLAALHSPTTTLPSS